MLSVKVGSNCKSSLVANARKLITGKWFGKNICELLLCRHICECDLLVLLSITNFLKLSGNVFGTFVKDRDLHKTNSSLVVTEELGRVKLGKPNACQKPPHPDTFLRSKGRTNIFRFYHAR